MAKELTTIITAAAAVRDAIETGENTAERVGGVVMSEKVCKPKFGLRNALS